MLQVAPNSVHYLLSLWQRMVASVPYVKATEPHMLETYTPEVTRAYITSRIDSVGVCIRFEFISFYSKNFNGYANFIVRLRWHVSEWMLCDCREGTEDPLDDTAMVTQQLEQLSVIGRCEYQKTCALIVQLFDQAAQTYQELLQRRTPAPIDLAIQEGLSHIISYQFSTCGVFVFSETCSYLVLLCLGQLTWLVYIIGAAIGGRVSFNSSEEHDSMDGELVCRYVLFQVDNFYNLSWLICFKLHNCLLNLVSTLF